MIRIVFCWAEISGYMAACWRALASRPGVEVSIISLASNSCGNAPYERRVMDGLGWRELRGAERCDYTLIRQLVNESGASTICLSGWFHEPYVKLTKNWAVEQRRLMLFMDTPRRASLRQTFARLKIGAYLDRMEKIFVAGERSWQFAKHLRIPEGMIVKGTYGIDFQKFYTQYDARCKSSAGWPRAFTFVGRYEKVKGFESLIKAYRIYRSQVSDPWRLHCCGTGPFRESLNQVNGVVDHGFVQPDGLVNILRDSGVFIMPSLYEPWGVAIVEASAAGLPVICSEECGASVEVVRSHFNGFTFPGGDTCALSAALVWCHRNHARLLEMGGRGQHLAAPFAAEVWADRLVAAISK